jgi:hypothetical protein
LAIAKKTPFISTFFHIFEVFPTVYRPFAMKESNLSSPKKPANLLGGSGFDVESPSQMKTAPAFQLKAGESESPSMQLKSSPGGLPGDLLSGFASTTGHDLSDVKLHKNSDKPSQVGALAYAQGNDIHLGAGQEQHLAHEAAHIVQQREGRVQANTQVAGLPVNDSPSLEHEADHMGEKAMQMKAAPISQLKQSPAGNVMQQMAVVQRQISTWGGDFDAVKYHGANGDREEETTNKMIKGVDMELHFRPNENVDAKSIGLVQTAKSVSQGDIEYLSATIKDRSIPSGEAGEGAHIDQYSKNRSPIYAVGDVKPKETGLGDSATEEHQGENGYRYKSWGGTKTKNAILKDFPSVVPGFLRKNSKREFETTALALKGNQKGTYYGSVRWGYEVDSEGIFSKLPFTKISDGTPSSQFNHAAELWNESKTSGGEDTLPLPVPESTFLVTTITDLMTAATKGGKMHTLAIDSRLEYLGETVEGKRKVKVIDGEGNHEFMYQEGWVDEQHIKAERE